MSYSVFYISNSVFCILYSAFCILLSIFCTYSVLCSVRYEFYVHEFQGPPLPSEYVFYVTVEDIMHFTETG